MKKFLWLIIFALICSLSVVASMHVFRIKLGSKELAVELASTSQEQATALMGRDNIKNGYGILFKYYNKEGSSFSLAKIDYPVIVVYINWRGKIIDMFDVEAFDKRRIEVSSYIGYVLFVKQGALDNADIDRGDVLTNLP